MGVESIALPLLLSAAGAATSYIGAAQQEKQAKKAQKSTKQAAAVQTTQLNDQAALERAKALRQSRAIRARALVSAASSGFGTDSGDVDQLLQALASDTEINLDVIDQNRDNNVALVNSRKDAELASIRAKESSPFLDAFTGLFGGAQLGLGIQSGIDGINDRADAAKLLAEQKAKAGNGV